MPCRVFVNRRHDLGEGGICTWFQNRGGADPGEPIVRNETDVGMAPGQRSPFHFDHRAVQDVLKLRKMRHLGKLFSLLSFLRHTGREIGRRRQRGPEAFLDKEPLGLLENLGRRILPCA